MKSVLLEKSYRTHPVGEVLETDDTKAEELVRLGYGAYVAKEKKSPKKKVMKPRKKRVYKTK